jgi:hypothetical protein
MNIAALTTDSCAVFPKSTAYMNINLHAGLHKYTSLGQPYTTSHLKPHAHKINYTLQHQDNNCRISK